MDQRRPKWMPRPRGWDREQVLAYMNMSSSEFHKIKHQLRADGMPQPDIWGKTDAAALSLWWDKRSGIIRPGSVDEAADDDAESAIAIGRIGEGHFGARRA